MGTFTERLKKLADEAGSGRALARALGISYRTVAHYLAGDREPPQSFVALMRARLGIVPTWLLTGEGPMRVQDIVLHDGMRVADELELEFAPSRGHTWQRFIVKAQRTHDATNDDLGAIALYLAETWAKADADERTWMRVQFRKAFPGFDEWTRAREGGKKKEG